MPAHIGDMKTAQTRDPERWAERSSRSALLGPRPAAIRPPAITPAGGGDAAREAVRTEVAYRLRTMSAHAWMRGKHQGSVDADFLNEQIEAATDTLLAVLTGQKETR